MRFLVRPINRLFHICAGSGRQRPTAALPLKRRRRKAPCVTITNRCCVGFCYLVRKRPRQQGDIAVLSYQPPVRGVSSSSSSSSSSSAEAELSPPRPRRSSTMPHRRDSRPAVPPPGGVLPFVGRGPSAPAVASPEPPRLARRREASPSSSSDSRARRRHQHRKRRRRRRRRTTGRRLRDFLVFCCFFSGGASS